MALDDVKAGLGYIHRSIEVLAHTPLDQLGEGARRDHERARRQSLKMIAELVRAHVEATDSTKYEGLDLRNWKAPERGEALVSDDTSEGRKQTR
jgi:hypothetical protein